MFGVVFAFRHLEFWLSIVMVGIGLYIRLGILETPAFTRIVEEKRVKRAPVIEVLKRQPKLVALTALARMGQQGPFYIFAAFIFTYGTTVLHSSRNLPRQERDTERRSRGELRPRRLFEGALAQTRPEPEPAREPCRPRRHYEPPRATAAMATCRVARAALNVVQPPGAAPAGTELSASP
jgi:hypothetical protein